MEGFADDGFFVPEKESKTVCTREEVQWEEGKRFGEQFLVVGTVL